MFNPKQSQWLNLQFSQDTHLLTWIEAFLIDRKAQNMAIEPLEPVDIDTVKALISTCQISSITGARDRAIFYCLLDTGLRAAEFCWTTGILSPYYATLPYSQVLRNILIMFDCGTKR